MSDQKENNTKSFIERDSLRFKRWMHCKTVKRRSQRVNYISNGRLCIQYGSVDSEAFNHFLATISSGHPICKSVGNVPVLAMRTNKDVCRI